MATKTDVLGFQYDDTEPAFALLNDNYYYYHFKTKRLLEKAKMDAWLTANGKAFASGELGAPSAAYLATHVSVASKVGVGPSPGGGPPGGGPPAAAAPITASVTKKPTATADDTGEITVAGGPADKPYMITVTTKDSTSGGDDVQNVNIAKGDTATQVAAAIAKAISDPAVTATSAGAVVTIKPSKGGQLDKLSVIVGAKP